MNKMSMVNVWRLKEELEAALNEVLRLEAELTEVTKDRDSWERRVRQLEAKRVEGLAPPYKFGGEGVA